MMAQAVAAAVLAASRGHAERMADLFDVRVAGFDPFHLILLVTAALGAAKGDVRTQMMGWSLARWTKQLAEIDAERRALEQEGALPESLPVTSPKPPIKVATPPESPPTIPPTVPPPPGPPSGGPPGGPPIPAPPGGLTMAEQEAWIQARTRGGELIRGLGNYVSTKTGQLVSEVWDGENILVDVDRQERLTARELVREKTAEAVAEGATADALAGRLAKETGDWSRNWLRIARTELQGAYNEGHLIAAVRVDGADARIARVPEGSACDHCRRLFLEPNGTPKIFTAKQLVDNGTNAGRKAQNWEPTIWPVHPHCMCGVEHVPAGLKYNADWEFVAA